MFASRNRNYALEVREDIDQDYGSGILNYNLKKGRWYVDNADSLSAEIMFDNLNVEAFVNRTWGRLGAPLKATIDTRQFTAQDAKDDLNRFKPASLDIPQYTLFRQYASEDIHYIQVKGFGFYHLDKDPAGLVSQQFNIGIRLKIWSERETTMPLNNYEFRLALMVIRRPMKSQYDIDRNLDFIKRLQ
jgi:hypothetical protein